MHRTVALTSFLLRRDTKDSNYSLESSKYIRIRGLVGFLHIHIRKRAGKQALGIAFRHDPFIYLVLRKDERHPVVDHGKLFSWFSGQYNKYGKVLFHAV